MKVFGLLFGLIVDVRWIDMGLFSGVSWDSVPWWLIGILVFCFVFFVASVFARLVFSRVMESWDSWFPSSEAMIRLQAWADEQVMWALPAAALHYLITLALWHDTESLLLAWLHLVSFALFLMYQKAKQLLSMRF